MAVIVCPAGRRPARIAAITSLCNRCLSFARYFWMHRARDRRGAHPLRSSARALSETGVCGSRCGLHCNCQLESIAALDVRLWRRTFGRVARHQSAGHWSRHCARRLARRQFGEPVSPLPPTRGHARPAHAAGLNTYSGPPLADFGWRGDRPNNLPVFLAAQNAGHPLLPSMRHWCTLPKS
jgi:hypothetical protein